MGRDTVAESDSPASAVLGPAQGPWELIIHQATLWAPEEKDFHLSVSTYLFIYVQAPGRGAGSHNPSNLGHCWKSSLCTVKKVEGQGSPVVPRFPSTSGKQDAELVLYGVCIHSLIHSFHKYFRAKPLKVLGSERGDTAPPSKEPPISWGQPGVRSAGVETAPLGRMAPGSRLQVPVEVLWAQGP